MGFRKACQPGHVDSVSGCKFFQSVFERLSPWLNCDCGYQALYATIPLYNLSQTLYKLSVATQLYRLFNTPKNQLKIKIMFAWILLCGMYTVLGCLFYCSPVKKAWDVFVPGTCMDRDVLHYTISALNILNDLLLIAVPLYFVLKLQIPKKQRLVLASIFSCGAFVTIVSIIRLKALHENVTGPEVDQPITGVNIALWSHLDINVAIIFLSLPALQALITRYILKKHYSGSDSHSGATGAVTGSGPGSRVLRSHATRNDDLDYEAGDRMAIHVQQSIEMKSYAIDDTGSEKDLIDKQNFGPTNYTTISAGGNNPKSNQSPV